jgi:peptidyl-prolyl cis-trans isomerase B (cyclophilin B)
LPSRPRRATSATRAIVAAGIALAAAPATTRAGAEPPWIPAVDVRVVGPDFGEFVIRPHRATAPNAVSAFLSLAARDAFDGLAFHPTVPGFLVQTGDPFTRDEDAANDGSAAPPWRIAADESPRSHLRGTVSLAWRGDRPETAGMEWFVLLADTPALDGKATPFGEVIAGLDVVERMAQVSTFRNRRPIRPLRIADVRLEAASEEGPRADAPPVDAGGGQPDSAAKSAAPDTPAGP